MVRVGMSVSVTCCSFFILSLESLKAAPPHHMFVLWLAFMDPLHVAWFWIGACCTGVPLGDVACIRPTIVPIFVNVIGVGAPIRWVLIVSHPILS